MGSTKTVELEQRCGVRLLGRSLLYEGTTRFWQRRIREEVGHHCFVVAWHPVWGKFAVYRKILPEDKARLRRPDFEDYTFRFAIENEHKEPCAIDERIIGFCRDDDLMFRAPWRWMRTRAEKEAEKRVRDERDDDSEIDAFTRDSEEHVHIASGRRGWAGFGTTGMRHGAPGGG